MGIPTPQDPPLGTLLSEALPRHHRRGTALFLPGDANDEALFVRTGLAKVVATRADGRELVLALRGPGAWLDGDSVIARSPRATSAVAVTAVSTLSVARNRLLSALHDEPGVADALLDQLAGALRSAFGDLRARAGGDPLGLLARRLVELTVDPAFSPWRNSAGESSIVRVPISQRDLASWAGISSRSAAAALKRLRDDGVVSTGRMRLEVHDVVTLQSYAATST